MKNVGELINDPLKNTYTNTTSIFYCLCVKRVIVAVDKDCHSLAVVVTICIPYWELHRYINCVDSRWPMAKGSGEVIQVENDMPSIIIRG